MFDKRSQTLVAFYSALLLALSASWAPQAQAVALGDITLNSALNEPLDASIELIQLNGLDESLILIGLASEQDFARVGIERPPYLQDVLFEVSVQNSSSGIVYLTTEEPIVEPYMDFIVDLRWSSGRMQREYTVLLDLQIFSEAPVRQEPVQAPQLAEQSSSQPVQQVIRTEPSPVVPTQEEVLVVSEEPEQIVQQTPPRAVALEEDVQDPVFEQSSEGEYTVQLDDTLWEIALQTRPDSSVSVHQMMLAIQRENQDAFIGSNINLLRAGQVLRVPDYDQILTMGQQEAINEVALQNQEFNGGELDTQPLAVNSNQFDQGQGDIGDELAVLSEADAQLDASSSQDFSARITALENQLMLSEENLDRANLENQELVARLADLNAQIDLLENIIAIEDQRIAELQLDLANQSEPVVEVVDAALPASESEGEVGVVDQSAQGVSGTVETQEELEPAAQVSSVRSAPQSESMVDKVISALDNTLILVGIGGLLILLVVGVLVMRKRREEDYDDEDYNEGYQVSSMRDEFDSDDIDRLESFDDQDQELEINLDEELGDGISADDDYESKGKSGSEAGILSALGSMIGRNDDPVNDEEVAITIEDSQLGSEPDIDIDIDLDAENAEITNTSDAYESFDEQQPEDIEQSDNLAATLNAIDQLAEKGDVELGDVQLVEEIAESLETEKEDSQSDSSSLDFVLNDETPNTGVQEAISTEDDELESFDFSIAPIGEGGSEESQSASVDSFSDGTQESSVNDEAEEETFDLGNLTLDENSFTEDDVLADEGEEYESLDNVDNRESLASKIDLAIAYEAMGDMSGAQAELEKVIAKGTADQVSEAEKLLEEWKES